MSFKRKRCYSLQPCTNFYPPNKRRRRRRRQYKYRRYSRTRIPIRYKARLGTRGTQVINRRRKYVGLPPFIIHKKKFNVTLGEQFAPYVFTGTWSKEYHFDQIPFGNSTDQRSGYSLRFFPMQLRVHLKHTGEDNLNTIRIIIVKFFKPSAPQYAQPGSIVPSDLLSQPDPLQNALYSSYTEQRKDNTRLDNFKVLVDYRLVWDSTIMKNIITRKFTIPARNVGYDSNTADGTSRNNGVSMFIVTDLPTQSVNTVIGLSGVQYYIDTN